MYNTNETLSVVQGDKLNLDIKLQLNNQRYDLNYGEKIWFDVFKKSYDSDTSEALIHIEQESNMIRIQQIDLEPGDYLFNVGIIFADGSTKTILPCLRNQHNILRVLAKPCINKHKITGTIFNEAFDTNIKESSCQCSDVLRVYKLLATLDKQSFVVVNNILERDAISKDRLTNGKVIKVADNGTGKSEYFSWNSTDSKWHKENLGSSTGSIKIEDVEELSSIISWKAI